MKIEKPWYDLLKIEYEKQYFVDIMNFLEKESLSKTIFPPKDEIFRALEKLPYDEVKVVIIGQDPYHGENEAHGLAFSVKKGVRIPPSLRNIFKELKNEYEDFEIPNNGCLMPWVEEGVLLLNATLTVEKDKANSHKNIGWQNFTDKIIELINEKEESVVFLFWGNFAISKRILITNPKHLILESVHPSPLSASRGFFGNGHFVKVNEFLEKNSIKPINWNL